MAKNKKIKKTISIKNKGVKEDVKKAGGEEEPEKESSTLSDGVLDAFDELAPVDLLLLEEETAQVEEDGYELDSGDYKPLDEW